MEKTAFKQFRSEVGHFFRVSVLNIAFAALLMAFGLMVVVREIVFIYETFTTEMAILYNPIILVVAVSAMAIGFSWIVISARIFEGVEEIKDEVASLEKSQVTKRKAVAGSPDAAPEDGIPEEDLTRLIVRMLSHYRDNHATINWMIYFCMLGSASIFLLGTLASLEYFQVTATSLTFTIGPDTLLLPALLITVGIAVVSLISSIYFYRFSKVWDERIHEIDSKADLLKQTLESDLK
ncbi:MAG: hypothetical protein D5R99_03800 [Methanocalculus sp. MSAO_Arc1]|uniref:hypothetical protein n=1 Tax=Methanocalculus TaxID=71151 RepID=UPI000FF5550C|nr:MULTISPECIES: hypothetical protein [unclassified Methanocalculus]MCP1662458.1 hypothetical protein [Methanocalculus sp. AMF5]RQD80883.1 MAG: hypothetical protein D5R99_03800 [Methanocalculus sp. MSAO_Arc1]